jgi:magnesium-protoporphyrin O-methyltransferase
LADSPDGSTSSPACDCCSDSRIATHFDKLTRERTEGGTVLPPMMPVTQRLYAQLADVDAVRPTILELGCGSAALLVNLLTRGAVSADGYDLSPEAIATAERRATDAGVAERVHFEVRDAALQSHAAHDWVLLDRAICCYPDMPRLVGAALSAAPRRVAFSLPASRGLGGLFNKVSWGFESFLTRFQNGACPGYVHSVDDVERRLTTAGYRRTSINASRLWYTAVWDRPTA